MEINVCALCAYWKAGLSAVHLHLSPSPDSNTKGNKMATKFCGFQSRKVAAFLAGLLTGILIGGCCSVFGQGLGVSVY